MVRELFISLVSKTTPNGYEYLMYDKIPNPNIDQFGNRYVIIGEGPHRHLFTCHLDTYPTNTIPEDIMLIEDGDIMRTDGNTLLGADDKAGMTILLTMIQAGVPGIYGFFLAEEIGLHGSTFAASDGTWRELMKDVGAVISFDRRGTTSIITHQGGRRTCSRKYAEQLQKAFYSQGISLDPDDTGTATDSLSFHRANRTLQCTNISVGYGNAHGNAEFQDIAYLERLSNAVTRMTWPNP
ncbi:MAG: M28 family peptidase [Ignavibacteria bacterium]